MSRHTRAPSALHSFDRDLLAWLRRSPRWESLPWGQRLQLAWRAQWASVNRKLSDQRHEQAPPPAAPVFIAGPWRSGTTVMHELLHAATQWPTPLTWQCMNATAYQLLPAPSTSARLDRPMDGLTITATSPQEDEFALLCLGVDSAYRAFLAPERLDELQHTLDPAHWLARPEAWLPRMERFMQGVLASCGRPQARLLLKSPNHSFRLPALLQRWPEAQVVWMVRDPVAVFHSNRKMWRAMFQAHALQPDVAAPGLDAFLAVALHRCAEVLDDLVNRHPDRLVLCRQETLLAEPRAEIERVIAALGLSGVEHPNPLDAALTATASGRVERYAEAGLPEEVGAAVMRLGQAQDRALQSRLRPPPNSGS